MACFTPSAREWWIRPGTHLTAYTPAVTSVRTGRDPDKGSGRVQLGGQETLSEGCAVSTLL